MTSTYYGSREKFRPAPERQYENAGGGIFKCLRSGGNGDMLGEGNAIMQNILSGWTFQAHGCGIYEDGKIDWDYSTGGCFREADA